MEESESPSYTLYKTRFLMLATVALTNMGCYMISVNPVATHASKYYNVTGDELDLIALVSWIINIPGLWFGIYIIGRFKLLKAVRLATTLSFVGCLIRALSSLPVAAYDEAVPRRVQFWITFFGQVIVSLGHPVLLTMSTKVSQVWFGERERLFSTPLLALSPILGAMVGQGIAPLIVRNDPANIPWLNIILPVLVVVGTVMSWTILRSAEPPTPPSRSAELLRQQPHMTLRKLKDNIIKLSTSRDIILIGISAGFGAGSSNMLLSQLNQFLCSRNYTTGESSLAAVLNLLIGILGAFLISAFARRMQLIEEAAKVGLGLGSFFGIFVAVYMIRPDSMILLCFFLSSMGFFGFAGFALSLELAVEVTYPMETAMSECMVHTVGQMFSVLLVIVGNQLYLDLPPNYPNTCLSDDEVRGVLARDYTPYAYLTMAVACLSGCIYVIGMNPSMKRTKEDKQLE